MIETYLEDIILSLNESHYIESFEVIKKKITSTDLNFDSRITLPNGFIP